MAADENARMMAAEAEMQALMDRLQPKRMKRPATDEEMAEFLDKDRKAHFAREDRAKAAASGQPPSSPEKPADQQE